GPGTWDRHLCLEMAARIALVSGGRDARARRAATRGDTRRSSAEHRPTRGPRVERARPAGVVADLDLRARDARVQRPAACLLVVPARSVRYNGRPDRILLHDLRGDWGRDAHGAGRLVQCALG